MKGNVNRKKNSILFSLLLVGILGCLSCAATARGNESPYVWLADNSKYTLLPPAHIENPMDNYQIVSASYGGRDYQLNAWVKADETGIDMTVLNELGATMGELSYRGGAVSFSSSVFSMPLKPEYIIADFQLCFYNAAALGRALEEGGLSLEETQTGRRILSGNDVIMEIKKSRNAIRLINHLRGYAYTLEGDFE